MQPPELRTGVVLLAAGQGRRFGGGKLTADFRGRPLWEWAAETAENADISRRILVIGRDSPISSLPGWRIVENPIAEEGMGTSIAAGVCALDDCDRALIMLADMPLVSRTHLSRLIAARGVAFTRYPDGTRGCPAIFPRAVFPQLETLTGDRGARSLHLSDTELVAPQHQDELFDVDDTRDLDRLNGAKTPDNFQSWQEGP